MTSKIPPTPPPTPDIPDKKVEPKKKAKKDKRLVHYVNIHHKQLSKVHEETAKKIDKTVKK